MLTQEPQEGQTPNILFIHYRPCSVPIDYYDLFTEKAKEDNSLNLERICIYSNSQYSDLEAECKEKEEESYNFVLIPNLNGILEEVRKHYDGKIIGYGLPNNKESYDEFIDCTISERKSPQFSKKFLEEVKKFI